MIFTEYSNDFKSRTIYPKFLQPDVLFLLIILVTQYYFKYIYVLIINIYNPTKQKRN